MLAQNSLDHLTLVDVNTAIFLAGDVPVQEFVRGFKAFGLVPMAHERIEFGDCG